MNGNLEIICQNLFNYPKKNDANLEVFFEKNIADYYAFQEYPSSEPGRKIYTTIINRIGKERKEINDRNYVDIIEKEWENNFPWAEARTGYWSEATLQFDGKDIILINVQISPSYSDQLRLILLKRLDQLKEKCVLLVGDFNAAFKYQTDVKIQENDKFLSLILEKGFNELLEQSEESNPHYTFAIENKKKQKWLRKKLDHVFKSKLLEKKFKISIEYLDVVNNNIEHLIEGRSKSKDAFSDHTGMKITISKKSSSKSCL